MNWFLTVVASAFIFNTVALFFKKAVNYTMSPFFMGEC